MLFNSLSFLIFFPVVTILFFLLPYNKRWMLLLAASCYFYMYFKPIYILILFFTIIIDYYAGIYLEKIKDDKKRKWFLIASLIANIGVLAIFKYYNFLEDNIKGIGELFGADISFPALNIILPVGLSFHTFQAMSYTFEVYRGNQKAEKRFGIYALYVMFYPQLVAGPIERPQNILHQFYKKTDFSYDNAVSGLNLIAFGLFKKIIIADRLAIYVNQVYGDLDNASSISTFLALIFFSFQIYCDFSGYSDIARGTARVMGFELMLNFDRPYLSQSISEFWKRWHISLSTWFRDYLYIPLGGNRVSKTRLYYNLFLVFMVSGLWHGASWTFVIWGALHGFFNIFGTITKQAQLKLATILQLVKFPQLRKLLNILTVFFLVSFAWVFFRAQNFDQAMLFYKKLCSFDFTLNLTQICAEKGPLNLLLSFVALGFLFLSYYLPKDLKIKHNVLFLFTIFFLIVILGKNGHSDFIYFQF
ncbi:MAG: MBOAT family protein [Bacteroidia bacterium]|nr:MBOAT family protein [Bacteroidia bacterium]